MPSPVRSRVPEVGRFTSLKVTVISAVNVSSASLPAPVVPPLSQMLIEAMSTLMFVMVQSGLHDAGATPAEGLTNGQSAAGKLARKLNGLPSAGNVIPTKV